MKVVDGSALLAFLLGEEGGPTVEAALTVGAAVGAANWSETAQKLRQHGKDWVAAGALLHSYPLEVVPVDETDAEWAAARWRRGEGLSLADRLCLALAHRLDAEVLTADTGWGGGDGIIQIR